MAKFYGTLKGNRSAATKTGTTGIRAAVQSYDGSFISELNYNDKNELMIELRCDESSSDYGSEQLFYGTFEELKKRLRGDK